MKLEYSTEKITEKKQTKMKHVIYCALFPVGMANIINLLDQTQKLQLLHFSKN